MSAHVLRSHVAQSQAQVGSDDREPLPPGTEEPSDSGNGVDGGDQVVTPPEVNVDDDNQGLSESQLSELVKKWRLLTATERDNLHLTEGQAALVARMAKSRKKRQQKLRKYAKSSRERESKLENITRCRERERWMGQVVRPANQAQAHKEKRVPYPHPKKGLKSPVLSREI